MYPEVGVRVDGTLAQRVIEQRVHLAEAHNRRQRKYREAALDLFEGKGLGMNTPAAKGTAWGCWQSICEMSDYRRGTNRGGKPEAVQVAEATMFGNRAAEKQRGFDACLALAQGEEDAAVPDEGGSSPLRGANSWASLN